MSLEPSTLIPPRDAARLSPGARALSVRAYLLSRLAITIFLTLAFMLGLRFGYPFYSVRSFAAGLAVFAVMSVGEGLPAMQRRVPLHRGLWLALPFDAAALSLLVLGMHGGEDAVFPIAIGIGLFHALLMTEEQARWAGMLIAVAYVFGHTVAAPGIGWPLLFAVFKGGSLVALTWAAARAVELQVQREARLQEKREHIYGLNQQLEKRVTELNALSEITEIVHSSLEFERVGPLVTEVLLRTIDLPACSMFILDRSKPETIFTVSKGLDAAPHLAPVPENGQPLVPAMLNDEHFECTTLVEHNHMIVVFCAEVGSIAGMSDHDRVFLNTIAGELAVAAENSQLYKLTKQLSVTDDLTGLHNYRYLQQRLDQEVDRALRYNKAFSFLMLDVDEFKKLNDYYGHIVGDHVLADLGRVMRKVLRDVDVVARYGGEEFSIVLPETDAAGAFVVAEKVREAIATHQFLDDGGVRCVHVTISVGLASFPLHAKDKETLLREADEALYQAKAGGRDRVRAPARKRLAGTGEAS